MNNKAARPSEPARHPLKVSRSVSLLSGSKAGSHVTLSDGHEAIDSASMAAMGHHPP
jgi:hypothetical protein